MIAVTGTFMSAIATSIEILRIQWLEVVSGTRVPWDAAPLRPPDPIDPPEIPGTPGHP